MAFQPPHYGLYFTEAHVKAAQAAREEPPLLDAWAQLHERERRGSEQAQWQGIRYRFDSDRTAGEEGVKCLVDELNTGFDANMTYIAALEDTLVLAHAFEMLRDHPAYDVERQTLCVSRLEERLRYLNELEYDRSYVEALMLAQVNLVAGITLEQEALFRYGVERYQQVINEDIHPQGHIIKAVETKDGGGLLRQLLVVQTLVLMAEAAQHAGVDLWGYSFRGVSVMTAFSYLIYYYFFPEKWRWDDNVTNEPFSEYSGFLEVVNHHAYPKDLKPMLDALRPIYDGGGGGLTTLSHGIVPKRRLFRG